MTVDLWPLLFRMGFWFIVCFLLWFCQGFTKDFTVLIYWPSWTVTMWGKASWQMTMLDEDVQTPIYQTFLSHVSTWLYLGLMLLKTSIVNLYIFKPTYQFLVSSRSCILWLKWDLFNWREQEAIAEPMESSCHSKSPNMIPLFTDWLKSWKCCEAKKLENGVPWSDEHLKLVRNPTSYTSFCKSDIFGSWGPSDKVYTGIQSKNYRADRTTNEESQQRYAQLFKSLMNKEQEKEFSGLDTPQVTSFPATCSHVADGEGGCFDNLCSRGMNTTRLFEYGKDIKYICYLANNQNHNPFHSSYESLLNILADRIEVKVKDIQVKVAKLERALFFKQSLRHGIL